MAGKSWPYGLCHVRRRDLARTVEQNVRRTSLEDGAIVQAQTTGRDLRIWRFTVLVKASNAVAFDAFIERNSNEEFTWTDSLGTSRSVRLRGGSARVELREVEGELLEGERYATGEIEVEGY